MENNETCCLARILRVIDVLQKESTCGNVPEGCDRPFLGMNGSLVYNTRPVTLYSKNGSLFTANYYVDNVLTTSSVFRVEDVNDCCATLRILAPSGDTFTSTGEFITVNLKCFSIVRCLTDIFLEI